MPQSTLHALLEDPENWCFVPWCKCKNVPESEGRMRFRPGYKKEHDAACQCDCWPCFYDWDEIDQDKVVLVVACERCTGEGCLACDPPD